MASITTRRPSSRGTMQMPIQVILGAAITLTTSTISARGQLRMGFYNKSCPREEQIVGHYVRQHVLRVPTIAAALLRTHFHDCFVRGCDASILLNSTGGSVAEKDAPPNRTLRGFDFIDRIKILIEEACLGVVSCADVLALTTWDAVAAIVRSAQLALTALATVVI